MNIYDDERPRSAATGKPVKVFATVMDTERMEGHSVNEILRQAAAWRHHVEKQEHSDGLGRLVESLQDACEPVNLRKRCLDTAIKYTQQDRNKTHGNPEDNFTNIARYWNAHLRARYANSGDTWCIPNGLDATDVALMMIGMKVARLSYNPQHEDSWIDTAGYAACGMEIALNGVDNPDPLP